MTWTKEEVRDVRRTIMKLDEDAAARHFERKVVKEAERVAQTEKEK